MPKKNDPDIPYDFQPVLRQYSPKKKPVILAVRIPPTTCIRIWKDGISTMQSVGEAGDYLTILSNGEIKISSKEFFEENYAPVR